MRAAIVGLSGPELTGAEATLFRYLPPCGVVLFARNIVDRPHLRDLVASLRDVLDPAAVIAVDQEGGRVARLRPPHWHAHPACATIGALAERDAERGRRAAYLQGALIGEEAKAAGFDMVFAPVLDLRIAGASDVIGDRSFGADPARVATLGRAMAEGLLDSGVVPVGKHAPGHGRAMVDSHHELPFVPATAPLEDDMAVFHACRDLPAMMTAHMLYEALDPDRPATLSARIIQQTIRDRIGFGGLLVSDDLFMRALLGSAGERAQACIAAGCDVALDCKGAVETNEEVLRAAGVLEGGPRARWNDARHAVRAVSVDPDALAAERDSLLAC